MHKCENGKNIVIVGGGIPGIFSALYSAYTFPESQIYLIESTNKLGGLYNRFIDNDAGIFDKGMHMIYETCIEEIDSLLRNCLNDNEWHFLEGNYKDIAGVFFRGKLETASPYLNINQIEKDKQQSCLSDFFLALENEKISFEECLNARDFFERRFGYSLTEELFEPIMKKLWKNKTSNLNSTATRIVLMDRISVFSESTTKELMKSSRIRSRIAYPNQMNLDLTYRNSQRGLYPKSFGFYKVIKQMEKKLKNNGVHIYTSSKLKNITVENNHVKSIKLENGKSQVEIDSIKFLHWSVSPLALQSYFGFDFDKKDYDHPLNQKYVFVLLKSPPKMDKLYYFYSLEPETKIYRVTNYSSYCKDAIRKEKNQFYGTIPLCIEMHYYLDFPNDKKVLYDCINEIIKFGIIDKEDQIVFSSVESAGGVPILTIKNCEILKNATNLIENLNIKNLILAGQSPEKGIFFLHDILSNIHNNLLKFKTKNS